MDSKDQKKGSGGEKEFSIQPIKDSGGIDPKIAAVQAQPGPAITQNMPPEEGSKADREERKAELNN